MTCPAQRGSLICALPAGHAGRHVDPTQGDWLLPLIHRPPANDRERAQLHPETTDLEREAARVIAGEKPMPPNETPVSPTGAAVIDGKGVALKIAAFVVLIAGAVAIKQPDLFPATELDQHIAQIIVTIGTVIGIASPGLRKQP